MPGKLVDVGGWKLHIHCTGSAKAGQPTVVLEAGAGDFSLEWSLVQPGVAQFARVCSYDRAGNAWSEMGPNPRTFKQVAYELHTLLEKAGEKGPFVLVGQSYGGWPVRSYQMTYPAEVAGMVFVEAGHDNPLRMLPNGNIYRASDLARGTPVPGVKTAVPLRIEDIPAGALAAMRAAAPGAVARANESRDRLPEDAKKMRSWNMAQIGPMASGHNPHDIEELALLRAHRASAQHPLGDMPVIVFTRGIPEDTSAEGMRREEERRQEHLAVSKMSRRGQHRIAARSGHHVQIDEPELVIAAIREVVAAVRP